MLQRPRWHLHNNLISSSLRPVSSNLPSFYHGCCYTQQRCAHVPTTEKFPTSAPQRSLLPESTTSSLDRPTGVVRRAQKEQHDYKTRGLEPWIKPHSLSESLEAHRQANHNGLARDGVPLIPALHRKRSPAPRGQLPAPRFGFKRPDIAEITGRRNRTGKNPAVCPPLSSEWRLSRVLPLPLRLPWAPAPLKPATKDAGESALERLSNEICACGVYLTPTVLERKAASNAFEEIRNCLTAHLGSDADVHLVGSRAAGTEGPISDLDINVRSMSGQDKGENMPLGRGDLSKLSAAIREDCGRHHLRLHKFINHASVPVIVGTHLPSGLEFQIQSTLDAFESLEVTRAFVAEYPTACILFKLLKQILTMRGLNKGVTGGLTSYPLLNMVVTSLKLAGPHSRSKDIAAQLLNFLDFWSDINFDEQKIQIARAPGSNREPAAISIDPISAVPELISQSRGTRGKPHLMSLEDPADPTNNLGKAAHRINHVQACFIEARKSIQTAIRLWDGAVNTAAAHGRLQQPILDWCLQGDYSSFEEARQQLRKHGRRTFDP